MVPLTLKSTSLNYTSEWGKPVRVVRKGHQIVVQKPKRDVRRSEHA